MVAISIALSISVLLAAGVSIAVGNLIDIAYLKDGDDQYLDERPDL